METADLERMWKEFNFVTFENGVLKNPFYNWGKSTQISQILDWFNTYLPDVFYDNKFSLPLLEILWEEFGDLPINNDDEIEIDFYLWEKGTSRFDIWHWFDEKLPNGLAVDFNLV